MITTSLVTSTNEATSVYWQESFSSKEINYQLEAYLAELEETP